MEVWVRGLDGKSMKVEFSTEIDKFKSNVAQRVGIQESEMRLVCRSKELKNDQDLRSVRNRDSIDLRLKLRGGGNCVGRSKKLSFEELVAQKLDAQSTQMLIEELEESTHMGDILERNPDLPFNEAAGQRALGEPDAAQQQVVQNETPHFFMSVIGFRVIHCYLEKAGMMALKDVANQGIAGGWRDFQVIFSKVLQKLRLLYKRAVAEEMKNDETKMQLDYSLNLSRGFIDKPIQGFHPAIEALHYFVSPFPLLIWNLPKLNFWYDLSLAVEKLLCKFHNLAVEKRARLKLLQSFLDDRHEKKSADLAQNVLQQFIAQQQTKLSVVPVAGDQGLGLLGRGNYLFLFVVQLVRSVVNAQHDYELKLPPGGRQRLLLFLEKQVGMNEKEVTLIMESLYLVVEEQVLYLLRASADAKLLAFVKILARALIVVSHLETHALLRFLNKNLTTLMRAKDRRLRFTLPHYAKVQGGSRYHYLLFSEYNLRYDTGAAGDVLPPILKMFQESPPVEEDHELVEEKIPIISKCDRKDMKKFGDEGALKEGLYDLIQYKRDIPFQ